MRRGGWRKRTENDGWEKWGGYMAAKVQKLEEQFRTDAANQKDGTASAIFSGVAIYVNGYTDPSAEELRNLMMLHGGQYHVYYSRSKTTHIIATNLPNAKIKELKGEKVIRPEWIVESIKAGRLLSSAPYQLYTKPSAAQKSLNFNPVCKPEDPGPGPSNRAKQLNNRVPGNLILSATSVLVKKMPQHFSMLMTITCRGSFLASLQSACHTLGHHSMTLNEYGLLFKPDTAAHQKAQLCPS